MWVLFGLCVVPVVFVVFLTCVVIVVCDECVVVVGVCARCMCL